MEGMCGGKGKVIKEREGEKLESEKEGQKMEYNEDHHGEMTTTNLFKNNVNVRVSQ